eukprot:8439154-Pyramimonas_sp.AAC.1
MKTKRTRMTMGGAQGEAAVPEELARQHSSGEAWPAASSVHPREQRCGSTVGKEATPQSVAQHCASPGRQS